jgi:2-polyprenyl-3-methyl-5-hydroxy-6-metoxy-1,4-benzoquinol methylase
MNCGLVYLSPQPTEADLLARSSGYQAMMRRTMQELRASRVGRLGLRLIRNAHTPPTTARGRVLDIGCSWGDYLAYMRRLGWETHGLELDAEAAHHAREDHGLDVSIGRAEDRLPDYPNDSFDVVTMWHLLEHVDNPSLVLAEVYRVLRPGGMLLVEVPNFDSFWARVLGRDWHALEPPFHLYHFSPHTLRRHLIKAGFHVTKIQAVAEPTVTIWSWHMLWNRVRRSRWDGHLPWNPTSVVLLYPIERLLAQFGLSNHMRAMAVK